MSFENRHWKLPLPNSKSYIRNVLTMYTYLSFLAIYPAWIGSSSDVTAGYGMSAAIVLIPLIPIITFLYAIVMLIRKRYRKWGWLATLLLGGPIILLGLLNPGFLIVIRFLITPILFPFIQITMFLGIASPVVLFFLGWRRQEPPTIEEVTSITEDTKE